MIFSLTNVVENISELMVCMDIVRKSKPKAFHNCQTWMNDWLSWESLDCSPIRFPFWKFLQLGRSCITSSSNKFVHCWYLCWQPGVLQTKKRKEIVTTHGETQKFVHGHLIIPVSQVIAENSLGMHTSCFLHRSSLLSGLEDQTYKQESFTGDTRRVRSTDQI